MCLGVCLEKKNITKLGIFAGYGNLQVMGVVFSFRWQMYLSVKWLDARLSITDFTLRCICLGRKLAQVGTYSHF